MNEVMITKAETKILRALDWLCESFPCFTSVRAQWTVKEDATITETMATDGKHLFWNRSFVDWMDNAETRWVVLHEAAHVFLGHHFRLLGIDQETRNQALDLAANWLIEQGCPPRLLEFGCFAGRGTFASLPGNQDAEFYARALNARKQQEQQQEQGEQDGDSDDQDGDSDDQDGSTGDTEGDTDDQDGDEGGSEGDEGDGEGDSQGGESGEEGGESGSEGSEGSSGEGQSDQDGAGSGSGEAESDQDAKDGEGQGSAVSDAPEGQGEGKATPKVWDPKNGKPGSAGEVLEVPAEQAEQAEEKWEEIVSDGVLAAEIAGTVPGWLKQIQKGIGSKNRVRWFHLLKNHMQALSDNGSTFERPNRKSAWRKDLIMPSNVERNCGKGAILVDTSGSMDTKEMDSALARIQEIVKEFAGVEVTMFQCDTRVCGTQKTFTAADFPLRIPVEWAGRGGTDMNPALRTIAWQKTAKEFAWVIVVSDMEWCLQSAVNTGLPTFWVKTSGHAWVYGKPTYGICLEATE